MPCNLYGRYDSVDLQTADVIPALIHKIHEAKLAAAPAVMLCGTGALLRKFLFVDDLADRLVFLLQHHRAPEMVNIGSGEEVEIVDLAALIAKTAGYGGKFVFDSSKPDDAPRKLLDSSRLSAMGWQAGTPLAMGLQIA